MKKNTKSFAILLLVAMLLCSAILCGCAAERTEYTDDALRSSVETAAKERVKAEISNEHKDFKIVMKEENNKKTEDLTVESITNDGTDWFASGTVKVHPTENESKVQTVDFSISLHLIDYVGQPTPTFKLIEFNLGEIVAP